ncbi:uncharacterized protein B0I36DRAFT_376479 [Microdochium trichocladiopsis]|uniref:Zn(2)-C6 fungal-type domain-containing protein n=1 Tax=Microdochium trichocladiopsis TaxID=1682393 RepID=A0A9P8XX90_9PEZI|nr:uncharacterized protein B0I36DRAFT_376479 [Microdochium trichocladiopsis]KAH7024511.1 hypothetical protein B0I36DRAFT_376479 [Microdochium trichocladiopsis]
MQQQPGPALPRRLNGRAAACDPCRARKLACDHGQPVCKRCKKRANDMNCVYREPALRSSPSSASRPPRPRPHQSQSSSAGVLGRAEQLSLSSAPTSPSSSRMSLAQLDAPTSKSDTSDAVPDRPTVVPGYWGLLSHGVVFEEAKNSLAMFACSHRPFEPPGAGAHSPSGAGASNRRHRSRIPFRERPGPFREMCMYVLRCLPGQANEILALSGGGGSAASSTAEPSEHKVWGDIVVDHISSSILGCLDEIRHLGDEGLVAMAEMLCDNTAQPMKDDCATHLEWLDQFSGPRLRWEALGLMWLYLDRVSDMFDAVTTSRLEWAGGREASAIVTVCVKYCIEVASSLAEANVLLVDLNRRAGTQDSMVHGDARMSGFKYHAAAVTMATFLGMHAHTNGPEPYQPTFCSEYQRRLCAHVFTSDKLGVSFTGRPPITSRRFWSTPLPLDIADADLWDPARLATALANLDSNGWSKNGQVNSSTLMRVRSMTARIRDELYEIALDPSVRPGRESLLNLYQRLMDTYEGFPASLKYKPEHLTNPNVPTALLYFQIACQLELLQTQFFIRRLIQLHDPLPSDDGDLLVTTFAMLSLILVVWNDRDRFSDHAMRRNFEWFVMEYGAPAGGVLCLELLRPTFTGTHFKDAKISRSSIIQSLTLLVNFLDWIKPSAPNGELCADCKVVIKRVLDHHLNNLGVPAIAPSTAVGQFTADAPSQQAMLANNGDVLLASSSGSLNYVEPLHEWMPSEDMPIFNFQLMDTFDWLRDDEQQPRS